MTPENKQRIIGIGILVVLIAVLVPFLFNSGNKPTSGDAQEQIELPAIPAVDGDTNQAKGAGDLSSPVEQSASGAAPLIAENFNSNDQLQSLPAKQIVQPSGPQVTGSEVNLARDGVTVPVTGTGGEDAYVAEEASLPPAKQLPSKMVVNKNKQRNRSLNKGLTKNKVRSKKGVKQVRPVGQVTKFSGSGWSVQAGSFSNPAQAKNLAQRLKGMGFIVYLQDLYTANGPMTRVLVGREKSSDKAVAIANALSRKAGIYGRVLKK